jgi:LacI family transcriptional regulator
VASPTAKASFSRLLVSEITNPFSPEVIEEFEKIAVAHGDKNPFGSPNHENRTAKRCTRPVL